MNTNPNGAPSLTVALELSEADRWFPATMLNQIPWGGNEPTVNSLGRIWEGLLLDEIDLSRMPASLPRATASFVMGVLDAEHMLAVVCGSTGKNHAGVVGPLLVKFVRKVRAAVEAVKAPGAGGAEPAGPAEGPTAA